MEAMPNYKEAFPDALIETVYAKDGYIPLFLYHQARINASLQFLGYDDHDELAIKGMEVLRKSLEDNNNRHIIARLLINIEPGKTVSFRVSTEPITADSLSIAGILLVYQDDSKKSSIWQNLKSTDRNIYDKARLYALSNKCNDAIILNEAGRVIETYRSNIWWRYGKILYTVPLSEGAIAGVFRAFLINAGIRVIEKSLTLNELFMADEVILTNAIRGVQRVVQINGIIFHKSATFKRLKALERLHLTGR